MKRRQFLQTAAAASVQWAAVRRWPVLAAASGAPRPWRTFEVTTQIEVREPAGLTRVWLSEAMTGPMPFQRAVSNAVQAPGGTTTVSRSARDGLALVSAVFPAGVRPVLTMTSRVSTRDYAVDLAAQAASPESRETLDYFRRSTKLIPTTGIVQNKALEITQGARTDVDKARAIYDWIVDQTHRKADVEGCGTGDIRFLLESGDLGGKCADLNGLYVGLARAAGLPARDVYGLRVAPSQEGYRSLGAATANVSKSQHCRAEVYLGGCGWVPVDPADVLKVALEEPPGPRPLDDATVRRARTALFGSWEMNWIAYNFAHDVSLPGSAGGHVVPFLMYPQAESGGERRNSLDPATFHYDIAAREVA